MHCLVVQPLALLQRVGLAMSLEEQLGGKGEVEGTLPGQWAEMAEWGCLYGADTVDSATWIPAGWPVPRTSYLCSSFRARPGVGRELTGQEE